jgi:uncharacterized RDD family membrane protein YckC
VSDASDVTDVMEAPVPDPTEVGHYAGPFSRLAAYVIDAVLVGALYSIITAGVVWIVQLVIAEDVDPSDLGTVASSLLLTGWSFLYFALPWAVSGRTPGMLILGLRVVRRDGSRLDAGHAFLRALTLPLSFICLGFGLIGIVVGREHRALHDVLANTTVVYAWDAQKTRLRRLARARARGRAPSGARA